MPFCVSLWEWYGALMPFLGLSHHGDRVSSAAHTFATQEHKEYNKLHMRASFVFFVLFCGHGLGDRAGIGLGRLSVFAGDVDIALARPRIA